jgi:hypothetical protein
MRTVRRFSAFVLAPLAGALVPIIWDLATRAEPASRAAELVAMGLYFSLFGFAAELVVGVPLLFVYTKRNLLTLPWFLLGGLLAGLALTIFFAFALDEFSVVALYMGLVSTVSALVGALAFWAIGGWSPNLSLQRTNGPAARLPLSS